MGRQAKGCPERDTRRPGGPLWPEQPAGAREVGDPEESVESFPWVPFPALASADLFRLPLGPEYGAGLEYRALAAATAVEELAYVCSSVATVYDGQCILAGRTVEHGPARTRGRTRAPPPPGASRAPSAPPRP